MTRKIKKCRLIFIDEVDESQIQELVEEEVGGPVTILGWYEVSRTPHISSKQNAWDGGSYSSVKISVEYEKDEDND